MRKFDRRKPKVLARDTGAEKRHQLVLREEIRHLFDDRKRIIVRSVVYQLIYLATFRDLTWESPAAPPLSTWPRRLIPGTEER